MKFDKKQVEKEDDEGEKYIKSTFTDNKTNILHNNIKRLSSFTEMDDDIKEMLHGEE
jgi:hypothetical protein